MNEKITASAPDTAPSVDTQPSRLRVVIRRLMRAVTAVVLLFVAIVLIGLIPVNNGFRPAPDGVEIFVTSNPVHADVIVPLNREGIRWRDSFPDACFRGDTSAATHVAVGWGDKGFFLETRTWDDLTLRNAANALSWPSESCMHITMKSDVGVSRDTRSVRISSDQYRKLAEFILEKFERSGDQLRQIKGAHYSDNDAFFEAKGAYHGLNTCNSWVGEALATAGIRVGWMTPLPKTVFLYLPD